MEDSEACLFIFNIFTCFFWFQWYGFVLTIHPMVVKEWDRLIYAAIPVVCTALLWIVLSLGADPYVRGNFFYMLFYLFGGGAWVLAVKWVLPFVGLSPRDEFERRNTGSALAVGGALLGLTMCYAGGNVGEGPGWWVVVMSVTLSTTAFYLIWLGLEGITQISETVTIERDFAAAIRLTAFLLALGTIMGASVSGDWRGVEDLFTAFFARAWPAVVMALFAAFIESVSKPTERQPKPSVLLFGVLPSVGYLFVALLIFGSEFTKWA